MPAVSVWDGGSLVKVRLPGPGERHGGGPRGVVKGFSAASRRRLLEAVHKVEKDEGALFLTLTIPDGVDVGGDALKRWLKAFWYRVRRRFPRASAMWRLEVKRRKSGQQIGMPVGHFHLLLWGMVAAPGLREWLSSNWYAVVGSGDAKHLRAGTRLDVPRSWQQIAKYAAKELYASKDGDAGDGMIEHPGRFWGFLDRAFVPWADELVRVLSPAEAFRLLRILRNWARADRRHRGLSPPPSGPRGLVMWRSFFIGSGDFWADRIGVIGWLV